MFTGFLLGAAAAYWVYIIFKRDGRFSFDAFQFFILVAGLPLAVWGIYQLL